ncbi:prolyl oligopeptidase family serine peptidase [Streptomyces griseocarneus]|uniref:prolyl oligopeptidase family serine peptidase n=1 Tax=Streptomyces griseocarneus TaxID=51201 RepID=UPI00167D07EA|nr:prolyl oligopeptidase family serine peptidase [Streptomyces griseocarneus]MBZ6476396.1 prolyl oligopeptidase family serine peptidase [Streptomyces griseocarneus]GHG79174.1 hypothetical protein GCM10018779_59840 [Streptomyces griseocarneus]
MDGERSWRDYAPGHRRWANVTAPAFPSLAEHNPGTVQWRGCTVDPGLCGLVTGRPSPHRVDITAGRDGHAWTVPVHDVLATALAWHPHRPLVAGLTVRDHRAFPWIADYEAQTLTVLDRIRVATAFTGLGGTPLAWCADGRLSLLVPASGGTGAAVPGTPRPVVLEASGPQSVTFAPPVAELKALAAARVAVLAVPRDHSASTPVPLTGPLLVRGLRATPAGDALDIEYAEDDDAVPAGTRGEAPPPEAPAGLHWRTVRVTTGVPGPALPAVPPNLAGGPRAVTSPAAPAPEPRSVRLSGGARLTVTSSQGRASAPAVLWIRASDAGEVSAGGAMTAGEAATVGGGAVAHLDLPLHWPGDATVEMLHAQITVAVRDAMTVLNGPFAGHHNGKLIVGGHSFGATLALIALAHVPGFTAAIVHSGCYNRTLTPNGFQQEARRYWEAPDVYRAFSAVHFADRLCGPVLIAHGVEDANPATPADQAVGLYTAIVAAGGRARLVLLPHEGHTVQYRESQQHLATEHRAWLARWATDAKRW